MLPCYLYHRNMSGGGTRLTTTRNMGGSGEIFHDSVVDTEMAG
ncbi:hypothetical protein [Rubritalea profundi]|nr:hypothetical protein [Rubritalea profundi]